VACPAPDPLVEGVEALAPVELVEEGLAACRDWLLL
jgi:hypothetical protein